MGSGDLLVLVVLAIAFGLGCYIVGRSHGKQIGWNDCWVQLGRDETDEAGA